MSATVDTIPGNLYDYPKYYDLVFGSDWKAEYDFLLECFDKFSKRPVQRLFEPACGTGRLMIKLAQAGYEVAGLDLNKKAVDWCNQRLARYGFEPTARVGDMANFRERRKYDAAFNMINSFRHLPDEAAAQHIQCVADVLAKGGIYLLGLHLTPRGKQECAEEAWSASRGNLTVNSRLWSISVDRKKRNERVGMTFDIYTPTKYHQLSTEMDFRTYSAEQMQALLERVPALEIAATFDFGYDVSMPLTVNSRTEDVVYVLRKR